MKYEPTWRKPAGMGLILLLITIWAVLVASVAGYIGDMPWPVQAIFYVAAGTVWILPRTPLVGWIERGQWR